MAVTKTVDLGRALNHAADGWPAERFGEPLRTYQEPSGNWAYAEGTLLRGSDAGAPSQPQPMMRSLCS